MPFLEKHGKVLSRPLQALKIWLQGNSQRQKVLLQTAACWRNAEALATVVVCSVQSSVQSAVHFLLQPYHARRPRDEFLWQGWKHWHRCQTSKHVNTINTRNPWKIWCHISCHMNRVAPAGQKSGKIVQRCAKSIIQHIQHNLQNLLCFLGCGSRFQAQPAEFVDF